MNIGDNWNGWIVDKYIGEGSFGKVYRVVRNEFGHTYESALKVIRVPRSKAEEDAIRNEGMAEDSVTTYFRSMVEDIVSEFALMSELRGNSNIVSYEDHSVIKLEDSFGWEIFIRMEMLTPLFDYLKDHTFTIRDVIHLGIDMCKALEVCQKYNIIHRDIKPENIFVAKQGNFKLGDFGIARQMEKTSSWLSKKGTYSYMAPEVYKGLSYNSTVDIYSLGIVLYKFLNNNRTPFLPPYPEPIRYSDKENANIRRMSGDELIRPCNAKGRLAEIVLKACAYDPKDRYESPREMRKALESIEYSELEAKIIYPAGDDLKGMTSTTLDIESSQKGETVSIFDSTPEEQVAKEAKIEEERNAREEEQRRLEEERKAREEKLRINREKEQVRETKKKQKPEDKTEIEIKSAGNKAIAKRPIFWVAVAVVVLLACIIPIGYKYYHHVVPSVSGMAAQKAQTTLEEAGLGYKVKSKEFSDSVDRNAVISQSIKKGETVKKGTVVKVVISKGKAIPAPDLANVDIKKATKTLDDLGLKIKVVKEDYSDTVKKNCVISQTPNPKADCELEDTIEVVKSKGILQVEVPDVVGNSQDDAEKLIKDARLEPSAYNEYSSSVSYGIVISQSVDPGEKIDKNSTVTIAVSIGPAPVYKASGKKKGGKKSGGGGGGSGGPSIN